MQPTLIEEKIAMIGGVIAPSATEIEFSRAKEVQINSRFGPIFIRPDKAIVFPHGLPGLPGSIAFYLTNLPNITNPQFKLLQSLNDHSLSFIVVPSTYDNQLLDTEDMDDSCSVLGIDKNNLLLLFIVTAHETPNGRKLSINAKAPIFVDALNRVAVQYVFQSNNYEIQHFIS